MLVLSAHEFHVELEVDRYGRVRTYCPEIIRRCSMLVEDNKNPRCRLHKVFQVLCQRKPAEKLLVG